jgi:hypothetical protein
VVVYHFSTISTITALISCENLELNYSDINKRIGLACNKVMSNVAIFWDIAPCSPYVNRRFGGTYHHHLQRLKPVVPSHLLHGGFVLGCFRPWRWRWYVPPKCRFTYGLHGSISQKMVSFIPTSYMQFCIINSWWRWIDSLFIALTVTRTCECIYNNSDTRIASNLLSRCLRVIHYFLFSYNLTAFKSIQSCVIMHGGIDDSYFIGRYF